MATPREAPMIQLTAAEEEELDQRPISTKLTVFTDDQFALRLSIAKKINQSVIDDPTTPNFARDAYRRCPVWAFYSQKEDGSGARRVYGASLLEDESVSMAVSTAMLGWNNDVVGGVPLEEMEGLIIDGYSPDTVTVLNSVNPTPGIYLDPLGFMVFSQPDVEENDLE